MLSELTRHLMNGEESEEVDFKENLPRRLAEHLVAFANAFGGYILIGVEEYEDENGAQRGRLVNGKGILLTDQAKQSTQNCFENIREDMTPEIELVVEEYEDNHGVYRIYIPEGRNKPYCTANGTYTIRRNGRKQALFPSTMRRLISREPQVDGVVEQIEDIIAEILELNKRTIPGDKWLEEYEPLCQRMRRIFLHSVLYENRFLERFDTVGSGTGVSGALKEKCIFRGEQVVGRQKNLPQILGLLDDASTYLQQLK